MKPQTVIDKAKELLNELGKENAINFFQKRIDEIGKPKDFQDLSNISGYETAIEYLKKQI
jgi:hypothetical protein